MGEIVLVEEIETLKNIIKQESNPLVIANKISYFLSNALREDKISLFEAYLLNMEELRFRRMGYTQTTWNGRVRISTCLSIINQKLLSQIFGEDIVAEKLKGWGLEAYKLNKEKREHYIIDNFNLYLDAQNSPELLKKLVDVRKNYEKLSDDKGPFHNEVFPYHYYSPEDILLGNTEMNVLEKTLNSNIEELLVELNLKY